MGHIFNMDSPVFQFLSRLADLMILNVIFIITCIPIFTIGAAWTSLYYVTLKMIRNEESYIIKSYFKSFKENFKQATIMWLIALVFIAVLVLDFLIIGNMTGSLASVSKAAMIMVAMFLIIELIYLFPVLSKFYNTIRQTFLNAFLMSMRHLPQTLLMLLTSAVAVTLTFLNSYTISYGILVWFLIGFALVALAHSWFLVKIFDCYIPAEEESESTGGDAQVSSGVFKNLGNPAESDNER